MRRSRSPSSSSVRCGCQYFQSTDPLPERRSLVGTPPPFHKMADHEYEPINPMPSVPAAAKVSDPDVSKTTEKRERRYIRIPNTDQIIIPLHGDSDEEINPDRYTEQEVMTEELPDPEAGLRASSTTPTTRTASRTEAEVNTSQVESSALEQLPLDKASREGGRNFGRRIKSQAGRIKTRLRNMPKPKLTMPERPKLKMPDIKMPETPKFLTERPKFNMPETPKFLTEKPKFLTEKPKFLTERPKFLTEKPKFLTERPKFLTERPKFNMPERPKFLRERPKFKMPERPKFNIDRSKLTMPKFDFMKKPEQQPKKKKKGTSSLRRPLREKSESARSEESAKKNIFETFKYRTYPRFFARKKERGKRASTPPPRLGTESSIHSSPESPRNYNTRWVETYRDIKFADDSMPPGNKENYSEDEQMAEESPRHFQDTYFQEVVRLKEDTRLATKAKAESTSSMMDSDKEQQSSGSSSARRRAGVLEEIDSDEFFLREKGLSREDVDVSRYLSLEIRDAFRKPKNSLARMDTGSSYDDEEELRMIHDEPPRAPGRRRGERPILRSHSKDSAEMDRAKRHDHDFGTFPLRPSRRKQSEPASLGSSHKYIEPIEKPTRKYRSKSSSMQASSRSLPLSDRQGDEDIVMDSPPQAPKRRSSKKDADEWIADDDVDVADEDMAQDIDDQRGIASTPVVPGRKTRSRGTSLADEDRTSRGVESLRSDALQDELSMEEMQQEEPRKELRAPSADVDMAGYAVVAKEHKPAPVRPPPPPTRRKKHLNTQLRSLKNHGINFFFTYPRRAIRSFHRTPARPARNYSTLGPSRPPRRNRVFREPVYVDGDTVEAKAEIESARELEEKIMAHLEKEEDDSRDLQSGEVVEKMKGRPLPPPPRPPRKTKEIGEKEGDKTEGDEIQETCEDLDKEIIEETTKTPSVAEQEAMKSRRDDFFSVFSQIKPPPDLEIDKLTDEIQERKTTSSVEQQTSFDIEIHPSAQTTPSVTEVTVSVQTDPLPDDFVVEETETMSQISESLAAEEVISTPDAAPEILQRPVIAVGSQQEPVVIKPLHKVPPTQEVRPLTQEPTPSTSQPQVVIQQVIPDKLHLSELDVDKLNVNELQARKIVVSDIDATTMQISEVSSKTGSLKLDGLEVSPEMIQSIASQIQSRIIESLPPPPPPAEIQPLAPLPPPQMQPPPPPPPIVLQIQAPPGLQLIAPQQQIESEQEARPQHVKIVKTAPPRADSESSVTEETCETCDETEHIPKPKASRSKGRTSPTGVIDEGGDELASTISKWRTKEQAIQSDISAPKDGGAVETISPEEGHSSRLLSRQPTSGELLAQLFSIWRTNLIDGINNLIIGVNSVFPDGDKRRDAQTAACILLVLIAGLLMLGFGSDSTVHHHHWDYVPPR